MCKTQGHTQHKSNSASPAVFIMKHINGRQMEHNSTNFSVNNSACKERDSLAHAKNVTA